jgi:coatomer subunit beta'
LIYLKAESNIESKWKQVGDSALASWNLVLAEEAFKSSKDLGSLLLLYTSTGDRDGLEYLSKLAKDECQNNIAFTCQFAVGNISACIDILVSTKRFAEAVFLSKTYKPSLTAGLVEKWKADLIRSDKEKIAKYIASPDGNLDLFLDWADYLEQEHS